jgi:N-acetylglucosaminyldiphosphoundecaprenol N-acetyl-beta-D-mannosaminyltransferase
MHDNSNALIEPFPPVVDIEDIAVTGFSNPNSLFERLVLESKTPQQTVVHYLNIHVANTAFSDARLKQILQESDLVYCDGAGIVLGSKLLGSPLPTRLTAADWFTDLLAYLAEKQCRVYLLGGDPGVPETALAEIADRVPGHTVVGAHHGFILNSPDLQNQVIDEINALQPDILIVGFGTPLQEYWIDAHRSKLKVPVIYAIGAVMDFVSQKVSRCPQWMGDAGFEWLYRLYTEPNRLGGRYVIGNPWFLGRIAMQAMLGPLFNGKTKDNLQFPEAIGPQRNVTSIQGKTFRRKVAYGSPRWPASG